MPLLLDVIARRLRALPNFARPENELWAEVSMFEDPTNNPFEKHVEEFMVTKLADIGANPTVRPREDPVSTRVVQVLSRDSQRLKLRTAFGLASKETEEDDDVAFLHAALFPSE